MNRYALIALIAASCVAPGFAADAPKDKDKDTPEAAFDALPTKAKTAAKNQLNGGKLDSVKKEKEAVKGKDAWDIAFTDKVGKKHEIEVTENGSVIDKDKATNTNGGYDTRPKLAK